MNRMLIAMSMLAALGAVGCFSPPVYGDEVGDGPVPAKNEVVMSPGMKVIAETRMGKMIITAGEGLKRSYTWDGATRSVEMVSRDERWYGSLGLYFPGPDQHWKEHKGITRGVVEEGQQHFKTAEEAQEWLAERKYMPYVYRNDGLMVGWDTVPARKQLNIEVWQILIDGKKPTQLEGAQDDKIAVEEPKASAKMAKKLVGTWELTKTEDKTVSKRTIEFGPKGTYEIVLTSGDKTGKHQGIFETEGDFLLYRPLVLGKPVDEATRVRIVDLTDDDLHLEFGDGEVKTTDYYKRSKR